MDSLCTPMYICYDILHIASCYHQLQQNLLYHLNTQSPIPKWEEVQDFLRRAPCPLIFGLCKTWLDSSVAEAAISVSTYNSYQRDRQGRHKGGIPHQPQLPVTHTNTVFQFQRTEEEEVLLALERVNTCKALDQMVYQLISSELQQPPFLRALPSFTKLGNAW